MKAQILGWEDPCCAMPAGRLKQLHEDHKARSGSPGDVAPWTVGLRDPIISKLVEEIAHEGFKPRKVEWFGQCSILPLTGSVKSHKDAGFGLVINWVLDAKPLDKSTFDRKAELICGRESIEVDIGDIFVFNANATHAWIYNGTAILAQVAVSKARKPA